MRWNLAGGPLLSGLAAGLAALALVGPGRAVGCGTEELERAADRAGAPYAGEAKMRRPTRPPGGVWPDYNRYVQWYESVPEARQAALRQGRMLFVMQLVGNLRDDGC
ncbi:MAG: hypothetical protein HYZ53_17310 [Planctomycetes bacterium]|nr:hypothetical protein [Planctomycetota bacterium]